MKAVVIGAGLSGTVAAARLVELGVSVAVVSERPGATSMHSGGWYLDPKVLSRYSPHAASRLGEALDFVESGLGELQLMDGPFELTDTDGVRRIVEMAPAIHARAATLPEPYGVVDLVPLGQPFAEMHDGGVRIEVQYPGWPDAFGRSFAAVAHRLEAPIERVRLTEALKRALAGLHLKGLLMPPILGLESTRAIAEELCEVLDMPIAEALGCLPSAPGLRLAGALDRWLCRCGAERHQARATSVDLSAGQIETSKGPIAADAAILATGGAIGGGLAWLDEVLVEPLCGLRLSHALPRDLMRAVNADYPFGGQLFRAGVAVNRRLQPLRYDRTPVHSKLMAVGDLLGGPEGVVDRCASGVCLLSGFMAAEMLAEAG